MTIFAPPSLCAEAKLRLQSVVLELPPKTPRRPGKAMRRSSETIELSPTWRYLKHPDALERPSQSQVLTEKPDTMGDSTANREIKAARLRKDVTKRMSEAETDRVPAVCQTSYAV